ncbi:hypothetical protein GCM10010350_79390 [Streptomyces galilaeus]|nr:hypothetical protein GCM10010350_79390 [Streptomyces galilaeus]
MLPVTATENTQTGNTQTPASAPAPVAPPEAATPPVRTTSPSSTAHRPGVKKAASAGTPADGRDPRFANGPLAVVDVDTNGQVLAYCIGGLVLHVPAKSIPALVEWTLCEAKLGAPKLSGPGKDADPLLVLTATALERYGLPATLTDEERHAGRLPEGHKVIKQLVRAEWKLTKRGLGPWARIYRPATGSDPGPCPASRDCARSAACRRYNEDGIVELLYGLDSMGWTSAAPQWNIQQAGANWHGVGAREFVEALRAWKKREDTLENAHHTEQLTYFDTCQGGGFYTLTASIANHRSRAVYDCHLSFQLPGVPVDFQPIRHLFEQFDAAAFSYFRPLNGPAVVRHHPEQRVPLEVVGYVVSHSGLDTMDGDDAPAEWVTGLVVRNPHRGEDGRSLSDEWPGRVTESELLVCALRSHHQLHEPKEVYHLYWWEYARTSDALALRPVADW